ncbi:hypothetical protein Tco_1152908 [Tanacetum coccineum]
MDNTNLPPEVPSSFLIEKVLKLNSILESLNLKPQSSYSGVFCKKEMDSDGMLIKLIKDDEYPSGDELNRDDDVGEEEFEGNHFDKFPTYSPLNILSRSCYNWIMTTHLAPRKNPKIPSGLNNFTGRVKGMHIFCKELYAHNGNEEIAYKIPHKIEQYDSLPNDEKGNMKSVYLWNDKDKKKGVEYIMSKILGFYKECLELGPEYQTGKDESSSETSENQNGGVT